MPENVDEKILVRAREIAAERQIGLTDAMIAAEIELAPKPTVPESFTVVIPVKPRVAQWILNTFRPTATHTTEERMAAYLVMVLNTARVSSRRYAEEAPEIGENGAVTMTRAQFQDKALKA